MRFADVQALVPYLQSLGVSHLYLSPSLQARSGSTHGYDVVDPTRVSDSLGGEDGLRELAQAGLGIILDIVPNHMGTGDENRWWADEQERLRVFDVDPETGHYRRFFDIDDLAGVRVEDPEVFELTHRKVLSLLHDGVIEGLRIDHPDGLADPAGYLERLAGAGAERVWVEKIVHPGEKLRDWPVSGTVGYEFLNDVQGLFVDPAGEARLTQLAFELTGEERPFAAVALEAQLEQARGTFHREVQRLRAIHDPGDLEEALARLPVYRTYVRDGVFEAADHAALAAAGRPDLFDGAPEEFVARFQQTSPPVTAKGIEDTAFYRYVRLLALNDVGGDPGRWGVSVEEFHAGNAERARRFPENLLVTQTHDTKRSGDARARIGALSALAEGWATCVRRWYELTDPLVVRTARRTARSGTSSSRRSSASGRSRPSGWRATSRRRCARPSATRTGSTRTTTGRRASSPSRSRCSPTRRSSRPSSRSSPRWWRSASARRSASCCSSSPSPACPTSTRATSSSTCRSSIPTTAGRSTGTRAARRWPRCATAPSRRARR